MRAGAIIVITVLCGTVARGQLPPGYVVASNVAYVPGATPSQRLDVYHEPGVTNLRPMVVYVHGGGWRVGNRVDPPARALLFLGSYVLASVDYTLSTNAPHPAQVRDVKSAIRWLRENAANYGADPARIGLWGNSAGGHLACLAAVSAGVTHFGGTNLPGVSDAVQAVFAAAPPTDLALYGFSTNGSDLSLYLGTNVQANPPSLTESNPANYVDADDPPFCFVHATNDAIVPPQHSWALHAALTNAGVDSRANFFATLGHVPAGPDIHQIAHQFFSAKLGLEREGLRRSVLVSSFNNNQVFEFNATNGQLMAVLVQGHWPSNAHGGLSLPHQPLFDWNGNLLVASAGTDQVLRYDGRSGQYLGVFAETGLDYPVDLTYGPDGALYVSSQLNDRVLRFNPTNGALLSVFVTNTAALDGPSGLAFGPDGHLYVSGRFNSVIGRYNGSDGTGLGTFGAANVAQPFGLRWDATGVLHVVSGNGNTLARFATNGTFLGNLGGAGSSLPIGVEFEPDGSLLVASYSNNRVLRYGTNGTLQGVFAQTTNVLLSGPNFLTLRPQAGELQFDPATQTVAEAAGSVAAAVSLRRIGGSHGTVSARMAVRGGTALPDVDYTLATGRVVWAHGVTGAQQVAFTVLPDGWAEGDETVLGGMAGALGGTSTAGPAVWKATIADRAFDAWRFDRFGTNANTEAGSAGGDPDADGAANLFEYAAGTDPRTSGSRPSISVGRDSGGSVFASLARNGTVDEVELEGEVSSDLASWTSVGVEVVTNSASWFVVHDAAGTNAASRFLRLRVSRP
jgi:acetyl esterase/lipase